MKKKLNKQISLGIDPHTGKRIRKRVYGDTPAELRKQEKIAISDFAKKGNPDYITFEQYEMRFRSAYMAQKSSETQRTYKSMLQHCKPLFLRSMRDITRTDLQQVINGAWNSPSMARLLSNKLYRIWESAVMDGVVPRNIAVKLNRPKEIPRAKRPLTAEEIAAIKVADFTDQERLLVDILYQFGLRPAEAFAINSDSVDAENRMLKIDKSMTSKNGVPAIKGTKNYVTRTLPIPDDLLPRMKTNGQLFLTEDGKLFSPVDIKRTARHIIEKINVAMGGDKKHKVTDMSLYNFRHNKATILYYTTGNLTLKAKATYMGHSEQTYLKTYSHLVQENEDIELLRTPTEELCQKCSTPADSLRYIRKRLKRQKLSNLQRTAENTGRRKT